jgi:hypothetical protein
MKPADIATVLQRLMNLRPSGAPDPHSPRAIAIQTEWERVLGPINAETSLLGDRLAAQERWPSIGAVTDIARSIASAPTQQKDCAHCDNVGWKPGRNETRQITLGETKNVYTYGTLHPCPSCRPGQFQRWQDGAYKPTGTQQKDHDQKTSTEKVDVG